MDFLKKPFGQPCKSYRLPKLKEYQNNYGISSVEHNGFFRADLLQKHWAVAFPPVTSVNKSPTGENEGLITMSRHGWAQVPQHVLPQTHPSSDQQAISDWALQTSVPWCVWLGRRAIRWQGSLQQHRKGLTFYWQYVFPEHIDSLNTEHQPNNLLKAIVCFLGLAKHLVHVIKPSKTQLQSHFFQENLPQPARITVNLKFLMASIVWNVRWTLNHARPYEKYIFPL